MHQDIVIAFGVGFTLIICSMIFWGRPGSIRQNMLLFIAFFMGVLFIVAATAKTLQNHSLRQQAPNEVRQP